MDPFKFQFLEDIIWHVCSYLRHKHNLLILIRLSDFMTSSEHFNIFSEGFLSQLSNTVGRLNLVFMLIRHSYKQIANNDFVAARKRFYNLRRGLCISASQHCRKMKFRTHINLALVSKIC